MVLLSVANGKLAVPEMCEAFLLFGFCFRSVFLAVMQTLWVGAAEDPLTGVLPATREVESKNLIASSLVCEGERKPVEVPSLPGAQM